VFFGMAKRLFHVFFRMPGAGHDSRHLKVLMRVQVVK
jgi:hypothetical protein